MFEEKLTQPRIAIVIKSRKHFPKGREWFGNFGANQKGGVNLKGAFVRASTNIQVDPGFIKSYFGCTI